MSLPLRDKQIEQLSFYIGQKKCLDLSDPGTGKTPPCCVLAYYVSRREAGRTLWSMPKSLLKKNRKELLRFTEFAENEVAIMRTDRANMTKNWQGPTIEATRRVATWPLKDGRHTHELKYGPTKKRLELIYTDGEGKDRILRTGREAPRGYDKSKVIRYCVKPKLGPDGTPIKEWVDVPEKFKDLIVDAAQSGVKVFICTFAFMSAHWERVLAAAPDIKLLLVDELHLGYGGPESQQTESFYWVNKHVERFVGMTGTLINGRLDSAFPAIHVIEPRYYGSYRGFIFEHAAVTDDYGRVTVWKNEPKLKRIIEKHSIRHTFEEIYGEEDVVFFLNELEISEEVKEAYIEFHEQAMLELDDGRILDGSMPGVALIRARQLLGHPETMLNNIPEWTPKDEWIQTELMQSGEKALIFASLKPEQQRIKRLCESLGLRVALINSDVSGPQREKIDEAAQRGELDVIVASGPTTAVGFNWEMFDLVIFASIDFLDTNVLQAYRRASRGTRKKALRVVFLRYAGTVEKKVYVIVQKKSELANRVDANRKVLSFESFEV